MATNPVSQPYNWTFRRVVWATLVLASLVFCFWLLYRFYQVIFILFIAIVMGTVIRPIVSWLYQRGLPRMAGVILVYLLLLILLAGFLWLLFPLIFEQSSTLAKEVPGYYQNLRAGMVKGRQSIIGARGPVAPKHSTQLNSTHHAADRRRGGGFSRAGIGLLDSDRSSSFTAIMILVLDFILDSGWASYHQVLPAF